MMAAEVTDADAALSVGELADPLAQTVMSMPCRTVGALRQHHPEEKR